MLLLLELTNYAAAERLGTRPRERSHLIPNSDPPGARRVSALPVGRARHLAGNSEVRAQDGIDERLEIATWGAYDTTSTKRNISTNRRTSSAVTHPGIGLLDDVGVHGHLGPATSVLGGVHL